MPVNYIPHPIQAIGNEFAVPGTRALNMDYQNLTLRPILVIITAVHTIVAVNICRIDYYTGLAGWPVMNWATSGGVQLGTIGLTIHSSVTFIVAPGEFYHARTNDLGGNVSALNRWWEINL